MTEQYICENADKCWADCPHKKPHNKISMCNLNCHDYRRGIEGSKCIPYQDKEISFADFPDCPYGQTVPPTSPFFGEIIKVGGGFCGLPDRGNEKINCSYNKGINRDKQIIFCAYESEHKEKTMKEYKIIKDFTIPDYIIAHQNQYGWTQFNHSCSEFQKDMHDFGMECVFEEGEKYSPKTMPTISANFWKHGVIFGFLEEVKEEVFCKVGDKLKTRNNIILRIINTDFHCQYIMLLNEVESLCCPYPVLKVDDLDKISFEQIKQHFIGLHLERI